VRYLSLMFLYFFELASGTKTKVEVISKSLALVIAGGSDIMAEIGKYAIPGQIRYLIKCGPFWF
jgi:3-phosphoglycerate kinase